MIAPIPIARRRHHLNKALISAQSSSFRSPKRPKFGNFSLSSQKTFGWTKK
jgi:hypothetical protein